MKKFASLVAATGIAVAFAQFLAVSPAHAKTIDCDKGHSIQSAVDTAVDGAVVTVTGTCTEAVFVDTDGIEIVGVGGATVIGPPNSFGNFRVRGRRVIIRNFTLRGETGVRITEGGSAEVRNNIIEDVTNTGIVVESGSYGNLQFNEITGNGSFSGIFIFGNANANINGNIVTNPSGNSIDITGNSSATVGNNTASDSLYAGISVSQSSFIFLKGGQPNTLIDNTQGFACSNFGVLRVDEEQIFSGNGADGIQFDGCIIINFVGVPFPLP